MSQRQITELTAFTPNGRHAGLGPLASRLVVPDDLPWSESHFPGVRFKTLMIDPKRGLLTALLQMDAGAVLPDHEHVMMEQTYVLEGYLEDKEGADKGLRVGPGEFVWRPDGSRHAAWTPEGGLMLAMFLMPNRFFEHGQEIDFLGQDWQEVWGSAGT